MRGLLRACMRVPVGCSTEEGRAPSKREGAMRGCGGVLRLNVAALGVRSIFEPISVAFHLHFTRSWCLTVSVTFRGRSLKVYGRAVSLHGPYSIPPRGQTAFP
jgi:hypothetical protein